MKNCQLFTNFFFIKTVILMSQRENGEAFTPAPILPPHATHKQSHSKLNMCRYGVLEILFLTDKNKLLLFVSFSGTLQANKMKLSKWIKNDGIQLKAVQSIQPTLSKTLPSAPSWHHNFIRSLSCCLPFLRQISF